MTTKPRVTDRSWLSGSEWTWARFLRWAVLVAAALAVTAPSPAQDGTYDPAPLAALEDQGVDAVPGGLPLETGGDVQEDAGAADDPNADGEPPGPPSYPDPANGATAVPLNTNLHWWQAPRADSYDVYFGTDNPPAYVGNTSSTWWLVGPLLRYNTRYYWQIVARNASGSTSGPVWSFRTTGCVGDLNCDDFIDFGDINVYVLALSNWQAWRQQYPDCPPGNAAITINEFAARLASAGGQPIPCSPSAGACRLANGPCELKTEADCTAADGVWQGAGTDCAPDADGEPPAEPTNLIPAYGATVNTVDAYLQWADGLWDSCDVYFGTDNPPPYVGNTPHFYWLLDRLRHDTTYYWQIVAKNAYGSTPGPVWWFHAVNDCRGDLNCDDFIDFGDINVYVLALSNWQAWRQQYPDCPPGNAAITINEFAARLASAGGQPIPCSPSAGACRLANGPCELKTEAECTAAGGVWQGAGTGCAPDADGEPPGEPSNPNPPHGATRVWIEVVLDWADAAGADSYDVYFGPDAPPPYAGSTPASYWLPNQLVYDTTYYWQVVAKNASGSTPGPVWSFDTVTVCRGDVNCDDFIDFGDINAFVLALSNWQAWKLKYPNCPPENTDINGDGLWGGVHCFAEINSFANLLASGSGYPIPCQPPAGACQLASGACELNTEADCTAAGGVWQGAGTVCTPDADGEPPAEPSNPDPPHGATGVSVETNLGWREAPRADSYDVYFGADNPPPYVGRTFSAWWLTYATLHRDTTYYWQIVARNASGSTPGPVWSFHTTVVCRGDTNCDGFIDFGDINAFVLALSNWQAWLLKYPDCPPENNDINGDKIFGGVVGGSNDIKAFVELLASAGGQPIPCE